MARLRKGQEGEIKIGDEADFGHRRNTLTDQSRNQETRTTIDYKSNADSKERPRKKAGSVWIVA